jgi:hypothetical protein
LPASWTVANYLHRTPLSDPCWQPCRST